MGSSTILDIITSVIISGFLLMTALRLNDQANETTILYHSNLTLQQNMTALTGILEHDFRRIGYCRDYKAIKDPADAIRLADTSRIRFWIDVNDEIDGSNDDVDSVEYYIGPPSEMTATLNPRDRVLYRKVNNQTPQRLEMGVTQFQFKFFNALGDTLTFPIAEPREIHSMEISLQIESFAPFDVRYTASNDTLADFQMYWRQIRLAARNLRNR
ncbi:MAG: hypothetical protein L0Y80_05540 [Ignavibacteriae bacterium]|nr:hypothetical protein [Ignavibacteriota bacterium]